MKNFNPEEMIEIDENRLDDEWIIQPRLYFDCANRLAEARRDWDSAKSNLDVVKADTSQAVRADPASFGLSKMTEASISEVVAVSPKVREAVAKVLDSKYQVDVYQALVTAMDHKRKALEKLVDLFLASYYSKPRASREAEGEVEKLEKRTVRRKGRRGKGG
ncbi:MAG: hypothetical protein ACXQTR_01105 [Candidatus Methanospirareceae archaeon]